MRRSTVVLLVVLTFALAAVTAELAASIRGRREIAHHRGREHEATPSARGGSAEDAPELVVRAAAPGRSSPVRQPRAEEAGPASTVVAAVRGREEQIAARSAAMTADLEKIAARHPGGAVTFVDCGQEPCAARLQAPEPGALQALLTDLSAVYGGHVSAELLEHLDGDQGRWYEADVAVGTPDPEPVPAPLKE
jgi:hypothetical protein